MEHLETDVLLTASSEIADINPEKSQSSFTPTEPERSEPRIIEPRIEGPTECLVCGVIFGCNDLARHQTQTRIVKQPHTYSSKKVPGFSYYCRNCGLYFSTKSHIEMHKIQSSCEQNKSPRIRNSESVHSHKKKTPHSANSVCSSISESINNTENNSPENSEITESAHDMPADDINDKLMSNIDTLENESRHDNFTEAEDISITNALFPSNIIELSTVVSNPIPAPVFTVPDCMVCGKSFSRLMDHNRHVKGVLLKHFYSPLKTSVCSVGPCTHPQCNCKLYFNTADNLASHYNLFVFLVSTNDNNNSSGMGMNISTQATGEGEIEAEMDVEGQENDLKPQSNKITTISSSNKNNTSLTYPPTTVGNVKLSTVTVASAVAILSSSSSSSSSIAPPVPASGLAFATDNRTSSNHRAKRARVLIPEDRRAFYSAVSLLIDPNSIPTGVKINAENFESYIPKEKIAIVERLKQVLMYDC